MQLRHRRTLQTYILTSEPKGGPGWAMATQMWSITDVPYRFVSGYLPLCAATNLLCAAHSPAIRASDVQKLPFIGASENLAIIECDGAYPGLPLKE